MADQEATIPNSDIPIAIRPATPDDASLVFATWLNAFKYGGSWAENVPDAIYFSHHHALIEAILLRPTARCLLLCKGDEPGFVYGWVVFEIPNVVHFCYVKKSFRGLGFGKRLIEATGIQPTSAIQFTHPTRKGLSWAKKLGAVLNPYRI